MEGNENERELYRRLIRRARGFRARAAESLKRSRALRKDRGALGAESDASQKRRRFPRQG
jgi:hypothetical protein